jgi:NADPH2:quinone reductase
MTSIVVPQFGGPEVLTSQEVERPTPQSHQVLVELTVSGLNYLDVAQRSGGTPVQAPFAAGVEGVGRIVELGTDVTGLSVGQRVGWLTGGQGSFSQFAVVDASKLVAIPDEVDDEVAVAALMQGITAHYLTTDTYPVKKGDTVLVHAAAGGLGHMLVQIAKLKGATVYGTTSTEEKAQIARDAGADQVFSYEGVADAVKAATGGEGASAVYDGVGAATFEESLAALRIRGTLAVVGAASGPPPEVNVGALNAGGSLYLTRPTVMHHVRTQEELVARAADVFRWIASGDLQVSIGGRFPVSDVAEAFRRLESRSTTGKIILTH